MDLSKINNKKWVLVLKTDPTKMNGYIPYADLVRDIFSSELTLVEGAYSKRIIKRPIEQRKYFPLGEVNITLEEVNKHLISKLVITK